MRFTLRSGKEQVDELRPHPCNGMLRYESEIVIDSTTLPGVRFAILRISFGRRMELSRRVRELARRVEFLDAGPELDDKMAANLLAQEIEAMYLHWGLARVDGLLIDGEPATVDKMLEAGPEDLAREIVAAIKQQCGLSEAERKN
jgi:hypothetical protein